MDARLVRLALLLVVLLLGSLAARGGVAQEFRIETFVYVGGEEQPVSHTTTLFENSAVYEFVDDPEQIIVYRHASGDDDSGVFILLDPATERRTEIEASRVSKLMDKLSGWAAKQDDDLLKFSANPEFKETFDAETGSMTLANAEWTYRVATVEAEDPAALERYRKFTDSYAELTAMLHASPPPGPRMALNAALIKHKVVPVEIRRTIDGDEKNVVRAVHEFSWRLSKDDRTRLDEAQKKLASFQKVENSAFIAARAGQQTVRGQSE
jgi:hypothetical protein